MEQSNKTVPMVGKRKKKSVNEIVFMVSLMIIPLLHFFVFWLYINLDSVRLSFQRFDMQSGEWMSAGWSNYRELIDAFTKEGSVLPRALLNSFTVFLWNDFVLLPISLFFAYMLFKKVPLNNMYKVIFFLPSIISATVLTLAFSYMLNNFLPEVCDKLGWDHLIPWGGFFANPKTAWWTVLIYGLWSGIGGNIVLMSGAMARIPGEVIEAGKIDGLGLLGEFWHIVIPLIGSTLATLLLMGTTVIFGYFLQPKLLLGDAAASANGFTIALYIVNNVRDNGTPQMAQGATIGVFCTIIGTPFVLGVRKILDKTFPVYEY